MCFYHKSSCFFIVNEAINSHFYTHAMTVPYKLIPLLSRISDGLILFVDSISVDRKTQMIFTWAYNVFSDAQTSWFFSAVLNFPGPSSFDILQGHSKATMLLIANNAAQGILSSFFFKYAGHTEQHSTRVGLTQRTRLSPISCGPTSPRPGRRSSPRSPCQRRCGRGGASRGSPAT